MAKKRITIEAGSGNVFADLGFADAKELSLKVELAMEVNRLLRQRGLTQAGSAKALGILQPHVSDLVRYRLDRFSVERLMNFLTGLGREVEIRTRPRPAPERRGTAAVAAVPCCEPARGGAPVAGAAQLHVRGNAILGQGG